MASDSFFHHYVINLWNTHSFLDQKRENIKRAFSKRREYLVLKRFIFQVWINLAGNDMGAMTSVYQQVALQLATAVACNYLESAEQPEGAGKHLSLLPFSQFISCLLCQADYLHTFVAFTVDCPPKRVPATGSVFNGRDASRCKKTHLSKANRHHGCKHVPVSARRHAHAMLKHISHS